MTGSRLRGWAGLLAIALCATPGARAQQDRPVVGTPRPRDVAPAPQTSASSAPTPGSVDAAGRVAKPVAAAQGQPETAVPDAVAPGVPAGVSSHPPDSTEGDRIALINQDVAQHPPRTEIASRDPSHLQTARMKLGGLLDRSVRSLENSEVGRVIDVMTGDDGRPAALELDVGGFLGVGNRRIAVAWSLFDLSRTGQNDPLRVALSAAQVRSAPAMDENGEAPVVTGATPVTDASTMPPKPDSDAHPPTAPAGFAPAMPPAVVPPAPTVTPEAKPAPSAAVPVRHPEGKPATPSTAGVPTSSRTAPDRHTDHDATASPQKGDGDERF